jgi:hypothetical protein
LAELPVERLHGKPKKKAQILRDRVQGGNFPPCSTGAIMALLRTNEEAIRAIDMIVRANHGLFRAKHDGKQPRGRDGRTRALRE